MAILVLKQPWWLGDPPFEETPKWILFITNESWACNVLQPRRTEIACPSWSSQSVSGQSAGHKVTLLKASHRQIFPANVPELWKLTMGEKNKNNMCFWCSSVAQGVLACDCFKTPFWFGILHCYQKYCTVSVKSMGAKPTSKWPISVPIAVLKMHSPKKRV